MLFWIGVLLLSLGWLLDIVSTLTSFHVGMGVLEANPMFLMFGPWYFIIQPIFFAFILFCWWYALNRYQELYTKAWAGYKIYDIFVFGLCMLLVFLFVFQIEAAASNYSVAIDFKNNTAKQKEVQMIEMLKATNETWYREYSEETQKWYYESITSISYFKMWIIILGGYLLFRLGHTIKPNGIWLPEELGDEDDKKRK